jgi:polyisoprenoid-binding protein YceI
VRKVLKFAIPAVLVIVALAAAAFWWFVLRDDAPPKAALVDRTGSTTAGGPATPDGTWTVQRGDRVFAGYRVLELFGGETIKKTAAGRSPAVTGTMTIARTKITAAKVTVDLTQLKSDRSQRDNRIKAQGLETDTFTTATFTLTQPVTLPAAPVRGVAVTVKVVGQLDLHGVKKTVTFDLQARWNGDTIDVAGSTPIVMKDYNIDPPNVGGFVSVDDHGTVELQLTFVKSV